MTTSTFQTLGTGLPDDTLAEHTVAATGNVSILAEGNFDGGAVTLRFRKNMAGFNSFNDDQDYLTKPGARVIFAPAGLIISVMRSAQQSKNSAMDVTIEIVDA